MNGEREQQNPEERIAELEAQLRDVESRYAVSQEENRRLAKENADLLRLSYRDSLTGLYNRRFFDESVEKLVDTEDAPVLDERRTNAALQEVGVIVVDADKFKEINDTYGHAAGDEVLKSISNALEILSKREATDIAARIGGDEFVVMLPGMTEEMAAERAKNLWSIIREFKVKIGEDQYAPITISVGVGSLKLAGMREALQKEERALRSDGLRDEEVQEQLGEKKRELFDQFLEQVDEAMYKVKTEKGRDQVARVSEVQTKGKPFNEAA